MAAYVAHVYTAREIIPHLQTAMPELTFPVTSLQAKRDGEWVKPSDGNVLKWDSLADLAFSLSSLLTVGYETFTLNYTKADGSHASRDLQAWELTQTAEPVRALERVANDLALVRAKYPGELCQALLAEAQVKIASALQAWTHEAFETGPQPARVEKVRPVPKRREITAGEYFDICVAKTATCESLNCIEYDEVFYPREGGGLSEVWGPMVKLGEGGKVGLEISSNGVTSTTIWVDRKVVLKLRN
jgi:hypothetical protein